MVVFLDAGAVVALDREGSTVTVVVNLSEIVRELVPST